MDTFYTSYSNSTVPTDKQYMDDPGSGNQSWGTTIQSDTEVNYFLL